MLHAKPRRGLPTRALPVLLLSFAGAAFAGLVALAPAEPSTPEVLAYADSAPAAIELETPVVEEREQARASRSRRVDAEARARAEAAAKAKAAAAAKAQAAAKAKAAAAAKVAAEAKAKAKAAAAAKAKAAARTAPAASSRIAGRCPVPNASFTDTWGAPRSGGRSHRGTDLMARYGSPVYAVASGRVRTASSAAGGISLYLDGDNGETYFYAHNSRNVARSGQRVQPGDLIARVGASGNASGGASHVHFERQVGGRSVNPYPFLRRIC